MQIGKRLLYTTMGNMEEKIRAECDQCFIAVKTFMKKTGNQAF